MQTTIMIYYNNDDKNPIIYITNDEGRVLSPFPTVIDQHEMQIEDLLSAKDINALIETAEEPLQMVSSLDLDSFLSTINDWIRNTQSVPNDMLALFHSEETPSDKRYNWTRYFRIQETSPGRFRPSVFRKPEYINRNKPAIVKPKDFFDRISMSEELSRQLMSAWEKYVTENQEVFVEILSQSFDDWMEIYGENTPVTSCMTGENGYDTARFYQLIPEAYPCIIRTKRSIVGRCIVWKVNDKYYQDRIYAANEEYLQSAIETFKRKGIGYICEAESIVIPIEAKQWERIRERGWFPYMDNLDVAIVKGKGIFLIIGNYRSEFDENDRIRIFHPTYTDGNDFIFNYVDEHYDEIFPQQ